MKNVMKTLMVCLVVTLIFMTVRTTAMAQLSFGAPPLWDYPAFSTQPLVVPTVSVTTGDILIDNFEYWDSPYNHGWIQMEPAYPTYGYGMGYATIFNTVLDLQQGSRVLDVYRPASIFLLGTPYAQHRIARGIGADARTNGFISFDFRAPLGIEPWDIFQMAIACSDADGDPISITLVPKGASMGSNSTEGMYGTVITRDGDNITVQLGRGLLDGSWHAIWLDLVKTVERAYDQDITDEEIDLLDPNDYLIQSIDFVQVSGQMFRLDNLVLRTVAGHVSQDYPDLFEMGPLYAQIFEPYTYLFITDYAGASIVAHIPATGERAPCENITDMMLYTDLFITDPNEIADVWVTEYHADPNLFGENDPNIAALFGRDQFIVDIDLPIFSNPNLRVGGICAERLKAQGTLGWNATVNGYGANGIQAFLLQPLLINPYDGMPTYLPAYYAALDAVETFGKPFYTPDLVFVLESALWNAGLTVWPNIAALDYTPQYFEDLIVTIEVTNGVHSDVRTIPISVVNYPVENYPPVLQLDIDDQIFYVGEPGEYLINFIDPDCFIFSQAWNLNGQTPATTHVTWNTPGMSPRDDMSSLTWNMTINGLPSYQYGPWINSIINQCTGVITWTPQFEGAYDAVVTCSDNRGGTAFGEITIFCVNRGTWLNHPPIILGGPTQPVTMVAGQEFILHTPNFAVEDPDGDEIYASCNIGTCGRDGEGSFMWKFQSNFPGSYMVEIVFYDIRGGYAVMEFFVDVKPWWSYPSAFLP